MRVQLFGAIVIVVSVGITPAYAGTTDDCYINCKLHKDHPRVCGYNFIIISFVLLIIGSPPRMRVQLAFDSGSLTGARITPAYAGTTYD